MKKIRMIGTSILCFICLLGFLTVLATAGSYVLSYFGKQNKISQALLKNASVDLSFFSPNELRDKYSPEQNILEKYETFVVALEQTIENFCTTSFPSNPSIKRVTDGYRIQIMQNNLSGEVSSQGEPYAATAYQYLMDFSEYLSEQNIGFLYMQLPDKDRIAALSRNEPFSSTAGEVDEFLALMDNSNIEFVHITEKTDTLKTFSLDASGHWMPKDALYATQLLAEALSNQDGYVFPSGLFHPDQYSDIMDSNPTISSVIAQAYGYDYSLPVPKNSQDYLVTVQEKNTYAGTFEDTLLVPTSNWRSNQEPVIAYHNVWRINNGSLVKIENHSAKENAGRRILVLGDSFSWPITAYLSQGIETIVCMHPRYFPGNVRTYIESYQPDTVVMLYYEGQIGKDVELNFGCLS